MDNGFIVEGVDTYDGSRTELHSCGCSVDAIRWMRRYVASENASASSSGSATNDR